MSTELTLLCLLWPGEISEAVEITIDSEVNSFHLKELILEGPYSSRLADVHIISFNIFKCSFPVDDNLEETLKTVRFDRTDERLQLMIPIRRLLNYFTKEDLPRDCIHVIFEIPPPEPSYRLPAKASEARNPVYNELLRQRSLFNAAIPWQISPLIQAAPSEFAEMQNQPLAGRAISWGRPVDNAGTIPVTLYHPVFRQFVDDCKTHQPCAADNMLVLELSARMSGFFVDEDARAVEFCSIMQRHGVFLSRSAINSKGVQFLTDGDVQVDGRRVVILASRNEIGGGSAEPYAQAILTYEYATWEETELYPMFNFPCLIITLLGPHISFSGAVWSTHPHLQILSAALPFFWHHTDQDMRVTLARCIGAFKKAILSLTECYKSAFSGGMPAHPSDYLGPCFPDQHQYLSLSGDQPSIIQFRYTSQLDINKLVFAAKTVDGISEESICVKFVRRYSKDAHIKCASMGVAPKLRGFEDIGGGWTMVVMDLLDDNFVSIYHLDPETSILPGVCELLKEKLTELHRANLVHGDVRDVNILVRRNGDDGLMLIDFDWAGVVGEVRYPINVFKGDNLWRPEGAVDGELILPEHDMAMLDRLSLSDLALDK